VVFDETHGSWSRGIEARLPSNAIKPAKPKSGVSDDLGVAGVSCVSAGNCVAVGNYETNAEVWEAMIIVERGGHWQRAIEAPLPAGAPEAGQDAVLLSVTCNGGSCTAAGDYVDPEGHQQGLLVSGNGSSWTAAAAPAAPSDADTDPNIVPSAIACAPGGDCTAVGTYTNPLQNSLGLLLGETGGSWSPGGSVELPANAAPATTVGDQTVVLSSVACPQAGACTAVGWYFDNDENGQGLIVPQQNGVWQPGVEVTLPADAVQGLEKQSAGLDWVSCPALGDCLATGVYTDAGYNSQGLLLSEQNGVWQPAQESPLPKNAGNIQYAATDQSDCTGAGDCTVIGEYNDRFGDVLGFALSETGGGWGPAVEFELPDVSAKEVKLSLQAILVPSGRPSDLLQVRRSRGYVYEYQAVEPGTATTSWYGHSNGQRVLVARGQLQVRAAGRTKLMMHLTGVGMRLLKQGTREHISATARFKPRGARGTQSATRSFTLS